MKREWKPGDVAVLMTEGGERIGFRCGVPTNLGWEYAREPGQKTWSSDESGYIKPLRPLVVIDLSDDPAPTDPAQRTEAHHLIDMLRETAENFFVPDAAALAMNVADQIEAQVGKRITKPEEPTGLGAVVEDAEGRRWIRVDHVQPWCLAKPLRRNHEQTTHGSHLLWRDVRAVRVLSEGVTP